MHGARTRARAGRGIQPVPVSAIPEDPPWPEGATNVKPIKAPQQKPEPQTLIEHAFWISQASIQTSLPYVVKGVFGKDQIIVFWGAPGSGKTFVTMELACTIGSGLPWHGRRTRKGIVLYVAAESARPYLENRFSAIKRERPDLANAKVLVVPIALDLMHEDSGDVDRVIETARRLNDEHGDVVMIVIDTLAVTFGGGNENAPEDMGQYVKNMARIKATTRAAVLIVHHSGKDEAKGMRGHTALLGALDAEMAIEGPPGGERILRTGKVRDGDGFSDLFAFTLERTELGTDQDGDPVVSCVVRAKDEAGTKRARQQRTGATLGKHQKQVLKVLEQAPGKRMIRMNLANKLKDDGMPRNRVPEAIAALLECGMIVAHNDVEPPEISLP